MITSSYTVFNVYILINRLFYDALTVQWGCGLYGGAGNLLTFVSFYDKNTEMRVICVAGYSPENTVTHGEGEKASTCMLQAISVSLLEGDPPVLTV